MDISLLIINLSKKKTKDRHFRLNEQKVLQNTP